ncbi:MAG: uracil-DNA glycosylase [Thermoplasmata archaeon]|nr:uracil-DNA glycosylase [Thermoplasmata archaeon]
MPRPTTVDEVWPVVPRTRRRSLAEWTRLNLEIDRCRRCPLGDLRKHPAIHRGSLRPRVLFVGEAPGVSEDRVGVPFVGAAGKRLDQLIRQVGLLESEFAVINVIKCHPPQNRFSFEAAEACRPFLARQIEFLQPIMIVTLGVSALSAFRPDLLPITRAAGHQSRWRGLRFFPMIHPAAAARSREFLRRWRRDGRTLATILARLGAA